MGGVASSRMRTERLATPSPTTIPALANPTCSRPATTHRGGVRRWWCGNLCCRDYTAHPRILMRPSPRLEVLAVPVDETLTASDDLSICLATALDDAAITLQPGDVVVVASKVVALTEDWSCG